MLLRSASSPLLNSWVSPSSPDHAPATDVAPLPITRALPVSHVAPPASFSSTSNSPSPRTRMSRALSESDLSDLTEGLVVHPKRRPVACGLPSNPFKEEEEDEDEEVDVVHVDVEEMVVEVEEAKASNANYHRSLARLFSSSGLDRMLAQVVQAHDRGLCPVAPENRSPRSATLLLGVSNGCGGGKICGVGKGGDGDSGFLAESNSNSNSNSNSHSNSREGATDAYYLKLIEANPGNSLILGNYCRFLKEVRGNLVEAEEYCERAILANPGDADVLSLYAGLIWETTRDAKRARCYFDQAVQSDPDDCYIMASYARFLWDAEEEDHPTDADCGNGGHQEGKQNPSFLFQGSASPPIASAS